MPEFHNLSELVLNEPGQSWGNLGYWQDNNTYSDACRALAQLLADKVQLNSESRVMDVGFGCGDQLLLWLEKYRVADVCGINYSESQTTLARKVLASTSFHIHGDDLLHGSVSDDSLWRLLLKHKPGINRVLALDCVYHFPCKADFISRAYQCMVLGGRLGLTDFILDQSLSRFQINSIKTNAMLKLSRIPKQNMATKEEYIGLLEKNGFTNIQLIDISAQVMPKFRVWLTQFKRDYSVRYRSLPWYLKIKYEGTANFLKWAYDNKVLRYVIVSADKN
jgi:microcystin synthetase protein McyJ